MIKYFPDLIKHRSNKQVTISALFISLVLLMGACQSRVDVEIASPAVVIEQIPSGFTEAEFNTLSSLVQIDDYPLYTMSYQGDYFSRDENTSLQREDKEPAWACSLFAAFGDKGEMIYGRNFDWDYSPGLLLFTDPPDGYASVSMVDMHYLGYGGELAFGLTDLPLEERTGLLDAPAIPFDGMNEAGLAIGMAAVPPGGMEPDPAKDTIDSLMVIRLILDQAATVDEAVEIIQRYNIDMGGGPWIHYLIAEKDGRSVLVEFSGGEIVVIPNQDPWQMATNFLLSEVEEEPEIHCSRYGIIKTRLSRTEGRINSHQAIKLLEDVAQPSTQWSILYLFNKGEIRIVMGGQYNQIYKFDIE